MKHIYFIGIGGIGMSAIARYYNAKGFKVSGYDKTPSPLTAALESEGIEVHYEDNTDFVPKDVAETLVVYTPAVPKDMGELVYVQENGYRVIKRSRMLGEIAEGQRCMAVAGTHGKRLPAHSQAISSCHQAKDVPLFSEVYRRTTTAICLSAEMT